MDDALYILERIEQFNRDFAGHYFEDLPLWLKEVLHNDDVDQYIKFICSNPDENISFEDFTTFLNSGKSTI